MSWRSSTFFIDWKGPSKKKIIDALIDIFIISQAKVDLFEGVVVHK